VTVWTEHRTDELKRRWAAGDPVDAIAQALGIGRGAVCSKAYRLRLDRRQSPIPQTRRRPVVAPVALAVPAVAPRVTRSQKQVLQLAAAGYSLGEAAGLLGISRSSFESCMGRIRARLQCRTNMEAVARALAFAILDPREVLASQQERRKAA
jgi:DNA-binding CsgD family transcriptional regulator